MIYIAENVDANKALEFIKDCEINSIEKEAREKENIGKYYEGYRKGLQVVKDIFYCSNYEKS